MKIISVVGARPNFMKIAPIHRAIQKRSGLACKIVHTGQHYDEMMSAIFFTQLGIPKPDYNLGVGGGTHTYQKAHVMLAFEEVLATEKPDLVIVVGDVNATAACAIVAAKMHIPVAHVEAGLRSGDRSMPEEINRMITDCISDHLFVTEHSGLVNLAREGVTDEKVHYVGNVMIDNLMFLRSKASQNGTLERLGVQKDQYVLMTMHRPHNVDTADSLQKILAIARRLCQHKHVVFPIHPRTKNRFVETQLFDALAGIKGLILSEPLGYLEFLHLMENAFAVVTDSGGIQEETTFLQIPCLTFRDSTERPITVEFGTNILLHDLNVQSFNLAFDQLLDGQRKRGKVPSLWDGKAADRIVDVLCDIYADLIHK